MLMKTINLEHYKSAKAVCAIVEQLHGERMNPLEICEDMARYLKGLKHGRDNQVLHKKAKRKRKT